MHETILNAYNVVNNNPLLLYNINNHLLLYNV